MDCLCNWQCGVIGTVVHAEALARNVCGDNSEVVQDDLVERFPFERFVQPLAQEVGIVEAAFAPRGSQPRNGQTMFAHKSPRLNDPDLLTTRPLRSPPWK